MDAVIKGILTNSTLKWIYYNINSKNSNGLQHNSDVI